MKQKILIQLLILIGINNFAFGQISQGGLPYSLRENITLNSSIYTLSNKLDLKKSNLKTDTIIDGEIISTNERDIGKLFPVSITPEHFGKWTVSTNGDSIWQLQIDAIYGKYMMLIFDDFYLPQGTELFVYSADKSDILGAFTSKNNTKQRKFSTTPLKTNSLIIEYYQPTQTKEALTLSIMSIGLIGNAFSQLLDKNFGTSGACMINAMCPDYDDWCDQRRSVALIIRVITGAGAIRWCSGSLLTNERRDGKPYFLTAFHCIDNDPENNSIEQSEKDEIQNWIFVFNYQSPNCNNPPTEPSLLQSINGATYINSHHKSDYALLQLNQRPPQDYNVFYNGWSNDNSDMTETGVCIHHPSGDIKKISEWEKKTSFYPKHWRVKYTAGSTEGGSSGSPLFNSNGYVVGQLHSGSAACGNNGSDYFGRFDKSWFKYGLDVILNPNGDHSGLTQYYIESMNGDEICKDNWYFASGNDLHTSNNVSFLNPSTIGTRMYNGVYNAQDNITAENVTIQSGTTVRFVAGESIVLKPGFHAEAGSNFSASIGDCLQNCDNGFKKSSGDISLNDNGMHIVDTVLIMENNITSDYAEKQLYFYDEIIKIYPNPNSGDFVIDISLNKNEVLKVTIINQLGQTVYTTDFISGDIINIPNPKTGIYFVSVVTKDKILTQKIIIK